MKMIPISVVFILIKIPFLHSCWVICPIKYVVLENTPCVCSLQRACVYYGGGGGGCVLSRRSNRWNLADLRLYVDCVILPILSLTFVILFFC